MLVKDQPAAGSYRKSLSKFYQTNLKPLPNGSSLTDPCEKCKVLEHGWLGRYRRLSKHYEELTENSEAMVRIAMINLMSKRVARNRG